MQWDLRDRQICGKTLDAGKMSMSHNRISFLRVKYNKFVFSAAGWHFIYFVREPKSKSSLKAKAFRWRLRGGILNPISREVKISIYDQFLDGIHLVCLGDDFANEIRSTGTMVGTRCDLLRRNTRYQTNVYHHRFTGLLFLIELTTKRLKSA